MAVRNSSSKGKQTRLRHLWLASLGAIAVMRREAREALVGAVEEAVRLRDRTTARQALAPRKSQPRRAARKPAAKEKATPRPAAARKQAEQRVVRKGR